MNEIKNKLTSRKKLVGEGKDCKDSYVIKVDLGRLSNLLEREGLISKDLKGVIIGLKDYPSVKIFGREINVSFLPVGGVYSSGDERIDIFVCRDKGWYRICKFLGYPTILNRKGMVRTLAHEIDHAIRLLRIKKIFKNPMMGGLITKEIIGLSNFIYPISPLEILARRFARSRIKNPEWLKCVKITRTKN